MSYDMSDHTVEDRHRSKLSGTLRLTWHREERLYDALSSQCSRKSRKFYTKHSMCLHKYEQMRSAKW